MPRLIGAEIMRLTALLLVCDSRQAALRESVLAPLFAAPGHCSPVVHARPGELRTFIRDPLYTRQYDCQHGLATCWRRRR